MNLGKTIRYSYIFSNTLLATYATYLLGQRIPPMAAGHGIAIFFFATFPLLLFTFIEFLFIEESDQQTPYQIGMLWIVQITGAIATTAVQGITFSELLVVYGLLQYISTLLWGLLHQILIPIYSVLKKTNTLTASLLFEQVIPWGIALTPSMICAGFVVSFLFEQTLMTPVSLMIFGASCLIQSKDYFVRSDQ